ncbi:MAG: response regulator [Chitinispirillia bacterium]|jgi:DNA-binding NarL/FixJ family response regulator
MKNNEEPFYYLNKLINVLLVDDDPKVTAFLLELFKPFRPYNIFTASTAKQALKILQSPQRIHVCILDLGINDIKNDEFFLLKEFGNHIFFVIFTGSSSPLAGFEANKLRAQAIIEKSAEFNKNRFIKVINRFALLNIINPKYNIKIDSLSEATDVLFKKSPHFVTQWAQQLGMTDRSLRHIWTKNLGANAKIILSIYKIFSQALSFFEKCELEGSCYSNTSVYQSSSYKQLEEFFHLHKSTITDFISYGNFAAFL